MMVKFCLTLLFSLLFIVKILGHEFVIIDLNQNVRADENCSYYENKTAISNHKLISIDTIWKSSKEITDKYLLTPNAIWFKIKVKNLTKETIYCRIDNSRFDSLDIFIQGNNRELLFINSIGSQSPIENRAFKTHRLISKLSQDSIFTVFFKVKSTKRITFPIYLGTADTILDGVLFDISVDILYFVLIIIILSFNLINYIKYKEKVYLYYILATAWMSLFVVYWKGFDNYFPLLVKDFIYNYSRAFFNLSILFLILFSLDFLKIKVASVRIFWYYIFLASLLIYNSVSIFLGFENLLLNKDLALLIDILCLLSMICGALYVSSNNTLSLKLYLIGFIGNLICITVFVFPLLGIKIDSAIHQYLIPTGSIMEAIFLSFALAQRIVQLKKEHAEVLKKSLQEEEELRIITQELVVSEQKSVEYRLMALRSVMNPHFLFNSLNSIQFYIAKNDKLNALNYLSDFSKLIRGTLNSSLVDRWPLSEEINLIKNYVKLESIRMDENLTVAFEIDSIIEDENVKVPPLILQPYVENAIEHGLSNKVGDRILKIQIQSKESYFNCVIEDNGIGREASRQIKNPLNKHKSIALGVTEERLKLINKAGLIGVEIIDLFDENNLAKGTRVEVKLNWND